MDEMPDSRQSSGNSMRDNRMDKMPDSRRFSGNSLRLNRMDDEMPDSRRFSGNLLRETDDRRDERRPPDSRQSFGQPVKRSKTDGRGLPDSRRFSGHLMRSTDQMDDERPHDSRSSSTGLGRSQVQHQSAHLKNREKFTSKSNSIRTAKSDSE